MKIFRNNQILTHQAIKQAINVIPARYFPKHAFLTRKEIQSSNRKFSQHLWAY